MSFNSVYSLHGLWPDRRGFQTRYLNSGSVSDLAATYPHNLSGNCMPFPRKEFGLGFFQQSLIAFIQHSHTFTQCSSPNSTGIWYTFIQGEPDTLALKIQLFSCFWNTIFKHPHISKELKIIMTSHDRDFREQVRCLFVTSTFFLSFLVSKSKLFCASFATLVQQLLKGFGWISV